MSEKKEVQAEDSPVENKTAETTVQPSTIQPVQKGFMDRALPWVIVALVFFLVGAIVTWLAIYQPKVDELTLAQNNLATATADIATLQNRVNEAEADLKNAKDDQTALQASYEDQAKALVSAQTLQLIYKLQADVNAARATLLNHDPSSSRQALSFVSTDLAELEKTDVDPAALSGFKTKIEDANTNLEADPQKSIDDLDALYSNLLLLISNYK